MTDSAGPDPLAGTGDRERVPLPYVERRPFDAVEVAFFDAGDALPDDGGFAAPEPTGVVRFRLRPRLTWAVLPLVAGVLLFAAMFSGPKLSAAANSEAPASARR